MHAAGITCSQRLGDLLAAWNRPPRPTRSGCSGRPGRMIPLPVLEEITDRSGIAPRIELLLPTGSRRAAAGPHLLLGMLSCGDHRPAHLPASIRH